MKAKKQVVLVIFDGWGIREDKKWNAIENAKKPFFDKLWSEYPHTELKASGLAVGLPDGEMGNSEVGHLTIGAGKIIDTDYVKISKAVADKQLSVNPAIKELFEFVKKNNSTLHVNGLVSPGGVHSHQEHLFGILQAAKDAGIEKVAIHAFTDGRDTAPRSAAQYLEQLEHQIEKIGVGFIASVAGRYYAMDRDKNWDRVERVEKALFEGVGEQCLQIKASEVIRKKYDEGQVDEHLEPMIFCDKDGNASLFKAEDGVLFFNFRADRARMLAQKISEKAIKENICFVTMTSYDKNIQCLVAYPQTKINTYLAKEISESGMTQVHVAETEKYAHVTYFLNGGSEEDIKGETNILVDSRKDIKTHDQAPEMRADGIAEKVCEEIEKQVVDFIVLNFANPDMVGHTANYEATIIAIEATDKALQKVVEKAWEKDSIVLITADHGNAELEADPETNEKITAHTTYPVPGIITDQFFSLRDGGGLADIAPTILDLLDIEQPDEMTGKSLISK
jgi:2,3-bisphosphoglycerate-independent phosphoglycerate mutase